MKQLNLRQRYLCILVLCIACCISSYAQTSYELSGIVTAADNNLPIPGVSILIEGTSTGTTTDFDGKYSINVSDGDVLLFSYIGFATQSVTINGQPTLDIVLQEDAESLEDVIVVGYGTRKKSHLTGAVAQVGGEDIAALQVPRVDEALTGKLAGVRVQNTNSQPGAAPRIQVRAAASITGNPDPLVIVDGYQITGDLSTVNPNDIESIEVLKDASSAAIYGARAANGVILITTKKGRSGKPSFSYNSYVSVNSVYKNESVYPTVGEWVDYIEANQNDWFNGTDLGIPEYDTLFDVRLAMYRDIDEAGFEVDYAKNTFVTGITTNHDFNVRGGSENSKYFASVGYLNAEGAIQETDFERFSGRMNLDVNLTEKLTAGMSINGIYSFRNIFPINLHDALRTQPINPIFHTAESLEIVNRYNDIITGLGFSGAESIDDLQIGDYAHERHFNRGRFDNIGIGVGLSGDNGSQAKIDGRSSTEEIFFVNANGYLDYKITEGLNIKMTLGADVQQTKTERATFSIGDAQGLSDTFLTTREARTTSWLNETFLTFDKVFDDKHDINAVAGFSVGVNTSEFLNAAGVDFLTDNLLTYSSFANTITTNGQSKVTRQSYFARANYAYDDKYLFSLSARADGDSRFGANNEFGFFPAASVGWNLHNEPFFSSISDTWSTFKLRTSYGSLGSTGALSAYASLPILNTEPIYLGGQEIAFVPNNIANPDLSWERTSELNFGTNLGFLNNRLRLGVDYYISQTESMILERETSGVTGFESIDINLGELENRGLEIELGGTPIRTDNFTWDINANLSTVETEVLDLGGAEEIREQPDPSRGVTYVTTVGRGIAEFYGYVTTGEEIDPRFLLNPSWPINVQADQSFVKDLNGDGVITEEDQTFLGNNQPDFTWGLTNNFNYKNWDLSFVLQGSHGAEVANVDEFYYGSTFRGRVNSLFPEEQQARAVPKILTDRFIQDASFVAMRNLTVGYTLRDANAIQNFGISSLRFYLASTNLFYIWSDEYTSYNPEGVNYTNNATVSTITPTTFGGQRGAAPITRSFTLGLNVNF